MRSSGRIGETITGQNKAHIVFGRVSEDATLSIESHMPERGVIFSDGIKADFLEFNSGSRAEIKIAERKGLLVV